MLWQYIVTIVMPIKWERERDLIHKEHFLAKFFFFREYLEKNILLLIINYINYKMFICELSLLSFNSFHDFSVSEN